MLIFVFVWPEIIGYAIKWLIVIVNDRQQDCAYLTLFMRHASDLFIYQSEFPCFERHRYIHICFDNRVDNYVFTANFVFNCSIIGKQPNNNNEP